LSLSINSQLLFVSSKELVRDGTAHRRRGPHQFWDWAGVVEGSPRPCFLAFVQNQTPGKQITNSARVLTLEEAEEGGAESSCWQDVIKLVLGYVHVVFRHKGYACVH